MCTAVCLSTEESLLARAVPDRFISAQPTCIEAGEVVLPREAYFVARRLDLAAVTVLL